MARRPRRASGWYFAAAAATLLGVFVPLPAVGVAATNPIQLENQQPGTTSWQFTDYNKAQNHEIEGYASLTSVNKGGQIDLMVSLSSSAQYTMDVYRMGWYPTGTNPDGSSCAPSCGGRLMQHIGPLQGSTQAACARDNSSTSNNYGLTECNWTPSYSLTVPTTWTSGNYIVKLTRLDGTQKQAYMTFVVRDDSSTAPIVYSFDVNTWQAYNFWAGAGNSNVGINLYGRINDVTYANISGSRAYTVSFDRPYIDQGSQDGAGNFMVWDFPMVRWMESQGYDMTYITDVDIESNPNVLLGHRVFVNAGHDEYYSDAMRARIKNGIDSGVNMAFFSANNIYFRSTWGSSATGAPNRRLHCDKGGLTGLSTVEYRYASPPQPENAILGVMQNGVATARPYLVYDASHWIYSGTGLSTYTGNGTTGVITSGPGQNALPGLIGYEFDERAVNASSLSSFASAEPPGVQQVGHSYVPATDNGVQAWSDATLYTAASGATVFSAGTIQWSFGVDNGFPDGFCDCNHTVANSVAQRITANILNRLSAPPSTPVVNLSSSALTYSSQLVGSSSAAQNVTLTNTGSGPLTINSIAITGTNAGDYAQTNTCPTSPSTLAANANCTISTTFTPTASGARTASVTIADDAPGGTQTISLSGTGSTATPAVTLNPTGLAFGSQQVGTTTVAQATTLTNTGTGPLTITSVGVTGTNAADYAQTNTCPIGPSTLAANANCTISTTFSPTATGSRAASVTITDNASGSPHNVSLTGTGTAPAVTLTPTSLTFAAQTVGTTSGAQTSTLQNNGSAPLMITSIVTAGANGADFAQMHDCPLSPATLGVGAMCTISVTFTPGDTGARTGVVSISDNAPDSPHSLGLSGTGTAATPAVSLSPSSLDFGTRLVGSTSSGQTSTLTNTGMGPLTISTISVTGTSASDFAQTNDCPLSPATLAAGSSCTISVTFTPSVGGARTANVTVIDNAATSPQTLALSGAGQAPAVTLAPTSLSFTSQLTGTTSSAQTSTLRNSGTAPLTIAGLTVAGTNVGDFTQTNDCPVTPATLAVNATCTVSVTFTPSAAGSRAASLSIADDASDSPQTIGLSGTGAAPSPAVSLSPSSLGFGSQRVATASAAQTVTLTNTGTGPLTVSSIGLSGANPGDYAQTNTCPIGPATLAASASCAISVTFTPAATGSRAANVAVTDNATGSPQTVSLSGTGTQPAVTLTPASLGFADQTLDTTSAAQTSTLTNSGTAPLGITSILLGGTNPADFTRITTCPTVPSLLAAGASCSISVTFSPTSTGARSASVSITDDAPGSPHSIALTGTGNTPATVSFDKSLGTKSDSVTNGNTSMNTTAAAVGGSRVFVFVNWNSSTRTLSSVSGGGLTWTIDYQTKATNSNTRAAIASAQAPSGLPAKTALKATFSGAASHGLLAAASFTGVAATSPLDGTASATQGAVAGWSCSLTTTNPRDVTIGWSGIDANTTSTVAAPSVEIHDFGDTKYAEWASSVFRIDTTTGSKTVAGTWLRTTNATSNLTICAAYKAG